MSQNLPILLRPSLFNVIRILIGSLQNKVVSYETSRRNFS